MTYGGRVLKVNESLRRYQRLLQRLGIRTLLRDPLLYVAEKQVAEDTWMIGATAEGLDPWENARLFGLLNMALTDGYIGGFEAKIHHNFWRPVTAIQLADIDGNPATEADPTWTPLAPTPPVPDHPSTHSVEGGAAAQVLKRFFKEDQISFSTCSLTMPLVAEQCGGSAEVLRSFSSFTHAADENGLSRVLVGFHFRNAVNDGIKHGRKIGNRTVNLFLKPVKK